MKEDFLKNEKRKILSQNLWLIQNDLIFTECQDKKYRNDKKSFLFKIKLIIMQRFFLENYNLWQKEIILCDSEIIFQIKKVLRAKIWDEFIFFDWKKFLDYKYKINSIDKKNIIFSFVEKLQKNKENKNLVLFQALPNNLGKIEEIINYWTQVWFSEFHFFRSQRSQDLKLSQNKIERFKKIIIESSELSNRNIIPKIKFLEKLEIKNISWEKLFFHTESENAIKLKDLSCDFMKNINIFIWPEGGFSQNENDKFIKNWFKKINLWDNILRTQVAWVVVGFFIWQND